MTNITFKRPEFTRTTFESYVEGRDSTIATITKSYDWGKADGYQVQLHFDGELRRYHFDLLREAKAFIIDRWNNRERIGSLNGLSTPESKMPPEGVRQDADIAGNPMGIAVTDII